MKSSASSEATVLVPPSPLSQRDRPAIMAQRPAIKPQRTRYLPDISPQRTRYQARYRARYRAPISRTRYQAPAGLIATLHLLAAPLGWQRAASLAASGTHGTHGPAAHSVHQTFLVVRYSSSDPHTGRILWGSALCARRRVMRALGNHRPKGMQRARHAEPQAGRISSQSQLSEP